MNPPSATADPTSTRSKPAKPPIATSVRTHRAPAMISSQFRSMSGTSVGAEHREVRSRCQRVVAEARSGAAGPRRGAAHASVKWLVTVKIVYGSRQFLSDRRASGSARFLTLLFALYEGDTWSPAHGAVRWVRGAISLAALDSGQT